MEPFTSSFTIFYHIKTNPYKNSYYFLKKLSKTSGKLYKFHQDPKKIITKILIFFFKSCISWLLLILNFYNDAFNALSIYGSVCG